MLSAAMKGCSVPALTIVAVLLTLLASPNQGSSRATRTVGAYLYGTRDCIEGVNGPGIAFYLRTEKGCPRQFPLYPYLEIDIRQWPISIGKPITIGPDNWALRCPSSHDGCAQAISGTVVFDHSTDPTGDRTIKSTGSYELKFQGGQMERGRFEIVCGLPCG